MLEIISEVESYLRQHLELSYPNEGCGFFYGIESEDGSRHILLAEAVVNDKEGDQSRRFEIHPLDYIRAERRALKLGLQLLGVYHSHPNHPAIPSKHDLAVALPYFSYIILSVHQGYSSDFRSWRLDEQSGQFIEEPVLLLEEEQLWQREIV